MAEMKVRLRQVGPSTSEATIREHKVLVDRPEAKGGDDEGPMGGEYFLTAVAGCFMSTMLAAIRAREADVSNIETLVTGTLAEGPARFTSVSLEVTGNCADSDLFERLVRIAENGCAMVNTLASGVDFSVSVRSPDLVRSTPPPAAPRSA
jgi:putative redox protein